MEEGYKDLLKIAMSFSCTQAKELEQWYTELSAEDKDVFCSQLIRTLSSTQNIPSNMLHLKDRVGWFLKNKAGEPRNYRLANTCGECKYLWCEWECGLYHKYISPLNVCDSFVQKKEDESREIQLDNVMLPTIIGVADCNLDRI